MWVGIKWFKEVPAQRLHIMRDSKSLVVVEWGGTGVATSLTAQVPTHDSNDSNFEKPTSSKSPTFSAVLFRRFLPKMNVLVYSGKGTTTELVKHTIESLRLHLSPNYAVVSVSELALLNDPWMYKTSMLVVPGGADLPYCDVLNGSGNERIAQFVRKGGKFIGFCAGGYYASKRCEFEVGNLAMEVSGPRELGFFPGTAKGCVYKGFVYESHDGCRAATMKVETGAFKELDGQNLPETVDVYYNGGGMFMGASKFKNVDILARYTGPTDVADEDMAAVIHCKVGKGDVLLSGTHPEFTPTLMKPAESDFHFKSVVEQLEKGDGDRSRFLRACLAHLGLKVNDESEINVPRLTPIYMSSHLDPTRSLKVLTDLRANMDFVAENSFEDVNDTFVLHDEAQEDHEYFLSADLGPQSFDDVVSAPKHIKVFSSGQLPDSKETPYFNMAAYFQHLQKLYAANNINPKDGDFGSLLCYSEVVTSTNTLLDANPRWLRYLPSGTTFTATTQIAGRGRGGNVWINPKGVMATSILFRIPSGAQQSSSIVTLQYLCSLAMIEAVLGYGSDVQGHGSGYEDMPLRLKWPNDMYALKPEFFNNTEDKNELSTMVEGDDEKWAKVSGALINSQFLNGQFHLVWGGGINVSNLAPTTSLNLILEKLNVIRAKKSLPALPPYNHEMLLAKLVFTMGQFYNVFEHSGLKPFLGLYYKRWFHLSQRVKLDAAGDRKTRDCIIKGITEEYGLLVAEDVSNHEILELQPDGNSFDIFKGLVYKKQT